VAPIVKTEFLKKKAVCQESCCGMYLSSEVSPVCPR